MSRKRIIKGPKGLKAFRRKWSGRRVLREKKSHRRPLLIPWPIGVGKSFNIDEVIEEAVRHVPYDVVVALFPTRRLIQERRWVRNPPGDVFIAILKPRPRKVCGRALNKEWGSYETQGLGLLGKEELCQARCHNYATCFWPQQYGKSLANYQVIYGTQAHLERASDFLVQIKEWTRAERVLVLLDENNFVAKSFRHHITRNELEKYLEALEALSRKKPMGEAHDRWIYLVDLLIKARAEDLRSDQWRFPAFSAQWAVAVQRMGRNLFGQEFRFLGYDFRKFNWSRQQSREKTAGGGVAFAITPKLDVPGCDIIIYSGTAHPDFLEFRLGVKLANPFGDYRFEHPDTRWYNLASSLGAKIYFQANAPQILDFFAQLAARRLQGGRRVLLVAKKCFLEYCAAEMEARLLELGVEARVVVNPGKKILREDPNVIPIINYGMAGTNRYKRFHCAYCLTGFYVNEPVVNSILQDIRATDFQLPLKFTTEGPPRRRKVGVANPQDRFYDIAKLAQLVLNQQEMDVVLQAVGRVRPYTKPREVFTFQCAAHPQLPYTQEFNSLAEARVFFGIVSTRERQKATTTELVKAAKKRGLTQQQVANKLKISLSTAKRHWNPVKPFISTHNQIIKAKTYSQVKQIVKLARQLPLSHVGFSVDFTYDNPGIALKTTIVHDPRTIQPVKLALVLVESHSRTKPTYHRFVVNLGKPQLVKALKPLFRLKVPFVGYDLKPGFFCLWQLGLPAPVTVWDGLVCEQALHLGRYHHKYAPNQGTGVAARISAETWAKEQLAFQTSLVCACQRHGVPLQLPPLNPAADQSGTFLSTPLAAAKLYGPQIAAAKAKGIHDHLVTVEMPFVETNARIEWTGVRVSEKKRARTIAKCDQPIAKLKKNLKRHGLTNYRGRDEMQQFFRQEGALHFFRDGASYSFDREQLKQAKAYHPVIPLILALKRLEDLRNSELLNPDLVGADGRIHPTYKQLVTATGRLTCHHPSILSVDSLLRPIVVPGKGRGIGEVDWSQVEVGIAGAVFGDDKLVDMFNTGDVYAAMAQTFFKAELPKSAKTLSTRKFKEKYPDLRDKMKACTLGIIYGLTPQGLATQLKCPYRQAKDLYDGFMAMFPQLRLGMKKAAVTAGAQGYASTVTNLHRYRGTKGPVQEWETRWFVNHCIQGTAAAIFKMALNRLKRVYEPYDAWVIVPLHDAVIFEAPLEALEEVAKLTARVMRKTLKEVLPILKPRVDINISKPTCWNKDGKVNGLSEWIRKTLQELSLR